MSASVTAAAPPAIPSVPLDPVVRPAPAARLAFAATFSVAALTIAQVAMYASVTEAGWVPYLGWLYAAEAVAAVLGLSLPPWRVLPRGWAPRAWGCRRWALTLGLVSAAGPVLMCVGPLGWALGSLTVGATIPLLRVIVLAGQARGTPAARDHGRARTGAAAWRNAWVWVGAMVPMVPVGLLGAYSVAAGSAIWWMGLAGASCAVVGAVGLGRHEWLGGMDPHRIAADGSWAPADGAAGPVRRAAALARDGLGVLRMPFARLWVVGGMVPAGVAAAAAGDGTATGLGYAAMGVGATFGALVAGLAMGHPARPARAARAFAAACLAATGFHPAHLLVMAGLVGLGLCVATVGVVAQPWAVALWLGAVEVGAVSAAMQLEFRAAPPGRGAVATSRRCMLGGALVLLLLAPAYGAVIAAWGWLGLAVGGLVLLAWRGARVPVSPRVGIPSPACTIRDVRR